MHYKQTFEFPFCKGKGRKQKEAEEKKAETTTHSLLLIRLVLCTSTCSRKSVAKMCCKKPTAEFLVAF